MNIIVDENLNELQKEIGWIYGDKSGSILECKWDDFNSE